MGFEFAAAPFDEDGLKSSELVTEAPPAVPSMFIILFYC
jgi:hypothetical protein